jgi:hypothetical protein
MLQESINIRTTFQAKEKEFWLCRLNMGISKDDQEGENGWQTRQDRESIRDQAMPRTNKV